MIRAIALTLILLTPGILWAQPQRIERNVARSKATISDAVAERAWKNGELVTTQGRVSASDGGAAQYRYRSTGRSSVTVDGGFFIAGGGSDDYFELVDRTRVNVLHFGAGAGGDVSTQLQAAFDAAISNKLDVYFPPGTFIGSVSVEAAQSDRLPCVYGSGHKTNWYSAGDNQFALTMRHTNADAGRVLVVSGITFRDNFVDTDRHGLYIHCDSGPVKIEDCRFNYLSLGLVTNATYSVNLKNTTFGSCEVGWLSTVRLAANNFVTNKWTVTMPEIRSTFQHSGINLLDTCSFSSCTVGWMMEDPDKGINSPHTESTAINTIFQGTGVPVWIRDVDQAPYQPGVSFLGCHFEETSLPSTQFTMDGSTINGGVNLEAAGQYVFVNCSPNYLTQGDGTYVLVEGVARGIVSHVMDPAESVFLASQTSGYQNSSFKQLSDVVIPYSRSVNELIQTRTSKRLPQITEFGSQVVTNTVQANGTGATMVRDGNVFEITTTQANTGARTFPVTPTHDWWYFSYDLRADSPVNVRFFPYGADGIANHAVRTQWETFHGVSHFETGAARYLRWWTPDGAGNFELANVQIVGFDHLSDLVAYQQSRAFHTNPAGFAQISIEDNATATTVASTQSDWSAKSQFVGFGTNFSDSSNATPDHTNDHITLTSAGVWEVSCVLTCSGSVVSDLWELALWKNNGATQVSTKQGVNIRGAGLTYEKQVTISGLVDASANDTIELWVQRTNGTGTLTITNAVMTATKVSD